MPNANKLFKHICILMYSLKSNPENDESRNNLDIRLN